MAGLELLYASVQNQLKRPEDVVVCCLHWTIIKQGFKCVGTGEQVPEDASSRKKSEMLPSGWNNDQGAYTLQYVDQNGQIFLLKVIKMDSVLVVHLMRLADQNMAGTTVDIAQYSSDDFTSFESAFKNVDQLENQFLKEALEKVTTSPTATLSQPTEEPSRLLVQEPQRVRREDPRIPTGDDDPLRVPPRHPQTGVPPHWSDPGDPFSIGRGDLDPIAGGAGGGMIFDPMRSGGLPHGGPDPHAGLPGRLPRGAVPPGARFDPFGPPDLDRSGNPRGNPRWGGRAGPDPDHLPPPGYDDMFM